MPINRYQAIRNLQTAMVFGDSRCVGCNFDPMMDAEGPFFPLGTSERPGRYCSPVSSHSLVIVACPECLRIAFYFSKTAFTQRLKRSLVD